MLKVVTACPAYNECFPVAIPSLIRKWYSQIVAQKSRCQRFRVKFSRLAAAHDTSAVDPGSGTHVYHKVRRLNGLAIVFNHDNTVAKVA